MVEKRDALKSWTILLAILTFAMSLLGTFLVRSGVLTSVRTFASDPARGVFILMLLVILIGGSLLLFALRAPSLKAGGLFQPISREGALMINNLLLVVAGAVVFWGTFQPLFIELAGGGKVSVGAPWYNITFVPFFAVLVLLMAVGPFLPWKRGDLAAALGRLVAAAIAALLVAAGTAWLKSDGPLLAVLGMALGVWLLVGTLVEFVGRIGLVRKPGDSWHRARQLPRAAYGMTLAHAGLAIAILGITGSSAWKQEEIRIMRAGESVTVAGYDYRFEGALEIAGPNYLATRAKFIVTRDGDPVAVLTPEKRVYNVQGMPTTEAAIHTTGLADLYTVIGDPDGRGGWTVRLFHEPLVPWLWAGILLMVAGGLVSLTDRRLRVGTPTRRTAAIASA